MTLQQLAAKVQGANIAFKAGLIRDKGLQIETIAGRTLQTLPEIGNLLSPRATIVRSICATSPR